MYIDNVIYNKVHIIFINTSNTYKYTFSKQQIHYNEYIHATPASSPRSNNTDISLLIYYINILNNTISISIH